MGNARKDRLCAKHADELKNGRIIINDEGLFVEPKTGKILNKDHKEPKKEKEVVSEKKVLPNVSPVVKKLSQDSYSVHHAIRNM